MSEPNTDPFEITTFTDFTRALGGTDASDTDIRAVPEDAVPLSPDGEWLDDKTTLNNYRDRRGLRAADLPRTPWELYGHQQMLDAITTDADPTTVTAHADAWRGPGEPSTLPVQQVQLIATLDRAGPLWAGPAAQAAYTHLRKIGYWLKEIAEAAATAGRQHTDHGNFLTAARLLMNDNPPVHYDVRAANTQRNQAPALEFAQLLSQESRLREQQELARSRAQEIMTGYEQNLADSARIPYFVSPPQAGAPTPAPPGPPPPGRGPAVPGPDHPHRPVAGADSGHHIEKKPIAVPSGDTPATAPPPASPHPAQAVTGTSPHLLVRDSSGDDTRAASVSTSALGGGTPVPGTPPAAPSAGELGGRTPQDRTTQLPRGTGLLGDPVPGARTSLPSEPGRRTGSAGPGEPAARRGSSAVPGTSAPSRNASGMLGGQGGRPNAKDEQDKQRRSPEYLRDHETPEIFDNDQLVVLPTIGVPGTGQSTQP
ncbi:hypothetical protein [Amycolatopsis samaneae]|uniref:PPE family protein n=1 Tax=Amycolatopsis samaneae TaxID=664691 RepID=A0ABW5G7U5_9PSEU